MAAYLTFVTVCRDCWSVPSPWPRSTRDPAFADDHAGCSRPGFWYRHASTTARSSRACIWASGDRIIRLDGVQRHPELTPPLTTRGTDPRRVACLLPGIFPCSPVHPKKVPEDETTLGNFASLAKEALLNTTIATPIEI